MLYQIVSFLLEVSVDLVASVCLLRLYMLWHRIQLSLRLGNPLSPFIFSLTDWLILPLRRVLPPLGRLDTACWVGAYLLLLAKSALLGWWAAPDTPATVIAWLAALSMVQLALSGLTWLVIAYALLSWVRTASDLVFFLAQLVEPLLQPLRRLLPLVGGVDLTPLVLLLILKVLEIVLGHLSALVLI